MTLYAINHYKDGDSIRSKWNSLSFNEDEVERGIHFKTFGRMVYEDRTLAQQTLREMASAKMADEELPDYSAEEIAAEDFDRFSYDTHNWAVIEITVPDEIEEEELAA